MSETSRECEVCGIDITDKKATARTCSPKCRKDLSRLESVTPNVTLSDEIVTLNFKFRIKQSPEAKKQMDSKNDIREAKYWYEVPLAAAPIVQKGFPEVPEYMNGRQYFLWWKNEFATNQDPEKGEVGSPLILNPYPKYTRLEYVQAGDGSRRWGS